MKKIYSNILEIKDNFDAFFLDAGGVFYKGSELYNNAKETMKELKRNGKKLIVVSNATKIESKIVEHYAKNGLNRGEHYDEVITSGETLRDTLVNNKTIFENKKNARNVYVLGVKNNKLFENTEYKIVDNLDEAELVYVSSVRVFENEREKLEKYKDFLFESKDNKGLDIKLYATNSVEVFREDLEEFKKRDLPIFIANPDYTGILNVINPNISSILAIMPGSIAKLYEEIGGEIKIYGKPYIDIYNLAFEKVTNISKDKILMVGDTLRTDIIGGHNVGIKTCLCTETGITANEIIMGKTLDELFKEENIEPDYLIKGFSI